MNVSPELGPNAALYFQSITGILEHMVKLRRIDILSKLSLLLSLELPREGHLETAVHARAYMS